MPVETAAAYHYNTHKHQGVLSRQFLSANPMETHSSTILVDNLYSDAAQLYFGLESSVAMGLKSDGRQHLYNPVDKTNTTSWTTTAKPPSSSAATSHHSRSKTTTSSWMRSQSPASMPAAPESEHTLTRTAGCMGSSTPSRRPTPTA